MEERTPSMVYSEKEHIPVGEAIQLPNGELMIRVKHKDSRNKKKTEDILLTDLNRMVAAAVSRRDAPKKLETNL